MSVLVDLVALYEGAGFTIQSNLSPAHFPGYGLADIPFTYVFDGERQLCKGGGIAFTEVAFFEALCERLRPRNIFVIGNAYGWSTLSLALINRSARVVAIDLCPRPEEERGLEVTMVLAKSAGLDVRALKARSPEDVGAVCRREFDRPVDLAFIDGGHTSAQQSADFEACRAVVGTPGVYVFHDVLNFGMTASFVEIARANPRLVSSLLLRTPSGMAISYDQALHPVLGPVVQTFTESEARIAALHAEMRRRAEAAKS